MPYVKVTYIAGNTVEVHKHFTARYGKKCLRGMALNPTPESQLAVNLRHAEAKLRRLINTNFGVGDWHLVLGYNRKYLHTPEEAKADKEKFLRAYRAWCKKEGTEPRYITVTEYLNKRIHHHLVIGSIPLKVLYEMWPWGRPHITPLDSSGNYAQLASYLIKETDKTFREKGATQRKRWTQSKGLAKPTEIREVIPADGWSKNPKAIKGYYLQKDSLHSGVHEVSGFAWQSYIMVKLAPKAKAVRKRE